MPLDPQVLPVLEASATMTPWEQLPIAQARQQMEELSATLGPVQPVARVEDFVVRAATGEIPVRVYRPALETGMPGVVYFHGGGWVLGSVNSHDGFCRALANASDAVVVSVDYRRAPDHKFPAAIDDAYAATNWVVESAESLGIDAGRVAVAGDSAGGNLSAVTCLLARDRGGPRLAHQVLIYPITDTDFDTPSYQQFAEGYFLTRSAMQWYVDQYLARADQMTNPYVAPLRAESLAGLPPATIITAEYDPLRDEAETYAHRLEADGVPTQLTRYAGMVHGFVRRTADWDQARRALEEISRAIRRMRSVAVAN